MISWKLKLETCFSAQNNLMNLSARPNSQRLISSWKAAINNLFYEKIIKGYLYTSNKCISNSDLYIYFKSYFFLNSYI